jgi:hypothetical protein
VQPDKNIKTNEQYNVNPDISDGSITQTPTDNQPPKKPRLLTKSLKISISVFILALIIGSTLIIASLDDSFGAGQGLTGLWLIVMISIPALIASVGIFIQNSVRVWRNKD